MERLRDGAKISAVDGDQAIRRDGHVIALGREVYRSAGTQSHIQVSAVCAGPNHSELDRVTDLRRRDW